jgi:O-antigen/teichoic acid export membrane protein
MVYEASIAYPEKRRLPNFHKHRWLFRLMKVYKKVFRLFNSDAMWALGDQGIVSAGNFFMTVVLARYLHLDEFGFLSLLLIIFASVQSLCGYFITVPLVTIAGKRTFKVGVYLRSAFELSVITSIVATLSFVAVLTAIGAIRGNQPGVYTFILACAALFCGLLQEFGRRSLFAEGRERSGVLSDFIRYGLPAPLMLIAFPFVAKPDHLTALLVLAAINLFSALPGIFARLKVRSKSHYFRAFSRRHWRFSRWLIPAHFLGSIQDTFLPIAAGIFLGNEAVAGWRIAQSLLGVANPLIYALENYLPRGAARAFQNGGIASLRKYLKGQALVVGIVFYVVIFSIATWADVWLGALFGQDFVKYSLLVRIYAASSAILFVEAILGYLFRTIEKTSVILAAKLCGAITTTVCAIPLTYIFGLPGLIACPALASAAAVLVLLRGMTFRGFKYSAHN